MANEDPSWLAEQQQAPPPPQYGTADTTSSSRLAYAWGAVKTMIIGCASMMAANGVIALTNVGNSSNPVSDMFVVR